MNPSFRSLCVSVTRFSCLTAALLLTVGCGLGPISTSVTTQDTVASSFGGTIHGGPNPVVGARVAIYATTSTGYGIGSFLQEATANYPAGSPAAHQDTDAHGSFSFAGGFTCPAGQQAYIVAYGGNTGAGSNPNSILIAPVGPCNTLYSGTTYTGGFIWVDELTTVATGYALNNFINITGDAVNGYTVGIGAPATNNASAGCVANNYYSSCTTTAAAGLSHAFANAMALVNNGNGQANATTTNGALIPTTEINTLGNLVQACVNSNGGGTNATTGAPTTVTSSSGTSHDGTICGKLFAFTSYTNTGLSTGTLTAAGNTLDAIKNLAKRPTGSASTFDSTCDSNSGTGTTTAVSCLFALIPSTNFYLPTMSAAPTDWMLGISYPKASLSTSTTNTFTSTTGPSCAGSSAGNGLLYPYFVQTDINDNVVILNSDSSSNVCADIIAMGYDGSDVSVSPIDNTATAGSFGALTLDAWGHAIVPLRTSNGVRFYQYGAGGTSDPADTNIPIVATIQSPAISGSTTTSAYKSAYAAVDGNSRIYLDAINAVSDWGYLAPTTLSHTAPMYTTNQITTATTSTMYNISVDINNNAVAGKGNTAFAGTASGATTLATSSGSTGAAGQNTDATVVTDTSGNVWQVANNGSVLGTSQTTIVKFPYTTSGTTFSWGSGTAPAYTYPLPTTSTITNESGLNNGGVKSAAMDGNNVMWFADLYGQSTTTPAYGSYLRGYDTVNNYGTAQLQGCKFLPTSAQNISAWNIGASSTTFTLTSTSTPAVGGIFTLSGFGTSTFFNGQIVTVTASTSGSFTVASTFGQAASSSTEAGVATSRTATMCGSNTGDSSYPSNTPYLIYETRGITVDTMGNLWVANGTQGQVNEILGLAAPTWPAYIHNGVSNKP